MCIKLEINQDFVHSLWYILNLFTYQTSCSITQSVNVKYHECTFSFSVIMHHVEETWSMSINYCSSLQTLGTCIRLVTRPLFYVEELLALRPTPKLEDHPLSAVLDCLSNIFAATLHIAGRSSIRNMTRHALVTGNHLWQLLSLWMTIESNLGNASGRSS